MLQDILVQSPSETPLKNEGVDGCSYIERNVYRLSLENLSIISDWNIKRISRWVLVTNTTKPFKNVLP